MPGLGRDLTEIASALISVALVALLVSHASGASTVIRAAGETFGGLLSTVELQNGFSQQAILGQ